MSSSRSVAAAVCPSAPFLVPRRACAVFRHVQFHAGFVAAKHDVAHPRPRRPQTQSSFLRKVKEKRNDFVPPPLLDEQSGKLLSLFRSQINNGNLEDVIRLYPDILKSALLTHNDTLHVAKLVHSYFRRSPKASKRQAMLLLLEFTDRIIEDLRNRIVPPHCGASLHLISFFKEAGQFDRGSAFWSWLQRRDDDFVDAAVYGAVIELLAVQGKTELPELEAVYTDALRRFPGTFAQYHLSPEAMVPDRGQPIMIKGLPTSLLQGITFARVARGDWRNAYLAFDTALRLFPTQIPERFFEIFIHGRPLAESYTVFMMACRSGVILGPEHLTVILSKLVDSQYRAPVQNAIFAIKGMLNAIYAYIGVGGTVGGQHLSTLVKGFEGLLSGFPSQGDLASEKTNRFVGDTARETVLSLSRVGVPLTLSTGASLVGLAGKARLPELLGRTLQDISSAGLEPNEVTRRSMVLAAGQIKHLELLELSWKSLVESAGTFGTQLDSRDWLALARASVNAGHVPFLREQMSSLSHAMTDEIGRLIEHEVDKDQTKVPRGAEFTEADKVLVNATVPEIRSQVEAICALLSSGKLLNFYENVLPISLVARPAKGSNMALCTVYDELTTDPRLPTTSLPAYPAMKSPSGYPLDALRYANWIAINELLLDAEVHETELQRRIEKARKQEGDVSTRLEAVVRSYSRPVLSPRRFKGDGDGVARSGPGWEGAGTTVVPEVGPVRQEIRRLRALQDQPHVALDS